MEPRARVRREVVAAIARARADHQLEATVVRDVAIDQPLAYEDVELDESSTILQLRRLQDQLLGR